ncbi:unnamed protein product [Linum tenue]|uniref:Uncharacterized protein n=1 Tax=Linum tenue TaxID=586396 RepID=A0AAV0S5K5_9ROSI|nr:unnamed protein product [Linum tenue]
MASCDMELVYPIPLMGENYFEKLNQSAKDVVDEIRKETPNFSQFIQVFYELMQSKRDPPLEAIWFYSALSFRSLKTGNEGSSDRLAAVKQLFQLVSGCSAPCSDSTSMALLAPVVFELYKLVQEVLSGDLGAKRVKKLVKKVQSLIGSVLGYVGVCSGASSEEKDSSLIVKFADLVAVWMEGKEEVSSFLPLLNDELRRVIGAGGFSVEQLAGAVTAELFLLKLCVDLRVGNRGVEMEKDLKDWIVGSITGFGSVSFFDILLRMLLEPRLPVASLLSSEEEILLRTTLYDAVILVEYTSLNPRTAVDLPAENFISIALKRLVLYLEATEFFRKEGNHKRAISYSSSFAGSPLPLQIAKFVTSQIGMGEEAGRLHVSSPKALIKWLFSLEGQGIRIYDDSISRTRVKLALDSSSKAENVEPEGNIVDSDLPIYIDNKGEKGEDYDEEKDEEVNNLSMTAAFMTAAHSMAVLERKEGKKRKEDRSEGKNKKKRSKLVAAEELSDGTSDSDAVLSDDGSSSESEVENPTSDEDA